MIRCIKYCLGLSVFALCSLPAMASVTVNSPASGATVPPQFDLSAVATTCSSQAVTAMGFSLDSSSNTTIVLSTSMNATATATTGAHTLHVKAWGNAGASCVTDVPLTVSAAASVVSVTTPGSGAMLTSPFALIADALYCTSQPVAAMGYSLDNGATTFAMATTMNTAVSAATGTHTLHVKAWGNAGAVCVSDIPITVAAPTTANTAGGVSVFSPLGGATVYSPFPLSASASSCSAQTVTAMGYSLDNSTSTAIVQGSSVGASVTASAGAHTLHVKSWGNAGAVCVNDVAITVASATPELIPALISNLAVSSPANGASVNSPFTLAASATLCFSQSVTSMSYAVDGGSATNVSGTAINTQVPISAGQHIVAVNALGASGAVCTAAQTITVLDATSVIPSYAVRVSSIQSLTNWNSAFDLGTSGSATGAMALVASPSLSGNARALYTTFNYYGGERYHILFGDDTSASNFFYDTWLYLDNSANSIGNIEMDLNQVMPNGLTVIYGFQCDGYSGTWDYTANLGTPTSPNDQWVHSSAACNPRKWSVNAWHHIQISYSRDDAGNVTYHSVWFDSTEQPINVNVLSAFALGWSPALLTNFQIDGIGSGANTVYIDNLTISRW